MSKINEALARLSNPTVGMYLDLMRNTEPPPLFHVWSLISAASACMTRRCWFDMGPIRFMPNQFIMLVGAPGVRKSTAVAFARKLVSDIPHLRFAPNSTGGHMQGLISAMQGKSDKAEDQENDAINEALAAMNGLDFGAMGVKEEEALGSTHVLNRSALYVAEGELTSFLGMKRDDFINFLGDMWDKSGADEHVYQLKRETIRIGLPCLNMIGGITPMHITTYLPPQAIGQGFTSRVLLVYSDYRKKIPWPEPLDEQVFAQFKKLMVWIFENKNGAFEYTLDAKNAIVKLYDYKVAIEDARFIHYAERRQAHMIKIAMALCALRTDNVITAEDVEDAHSLLVLTEAGMTEALGEYGLSPLALAKARVSDILRVAKMPLSHQRILIAAGSDVQRTDVNRALHELVQTQQIVEVVLHDNNGIERTGYVWPMESNPFKANSRVKVDYLLAEATTNRSRGDSATARLVNHLSGDDAEGSGAAARTQQTGPDWKNLPESTHGVGRAEPVRISGTAPATVMHSEYEQALPSLAQQGYSSIMDKVRALVRKRERV